MPKYDQVKAEHVVPGIRALLEELHAELDALEASVTPTWEGLVEPVERIVDRISRAWGTVSHLKASAKQRPPLDSWGWAGSLLHGGWMGYVSIQTQFNMIQI